LILPNGKPSFVFHFIFTWIEKIYPAHAGQLKSAGGPHAARGLD